MASFHGLYRTVTFYAPTVPQTGCTNSGLSITNPNKCTIFCFKKIPQNPTELCIKFQSLQYECPLPNPKKMMAKKMQKGSKQPPVVVMVNFREIKHPLHQATVYATTFGASFDKIFDTKRSKAFRQRAACEDPMGVKNTWGVICGNPRKPHENHCILYIYIYILCLHFGSFLVNVGYCTYTILYIGSYKTKVGTTTIDRKYIKWSMCNCYVSSQHKCIQQKIRAHDL